MSIQVKFYGDLKEKIQPQQTTDVGSPNIVNIDNKGINNVSDILKMYIIEENEISHIFINGKYSGISKKIDFGDKVGDKVIIAIFPKNMGVLYKWYFSKEEND